MLVQSDSKRTKERYAEIQHYMQTQVRGGSRDFICKSYRQCLSSCQDLLYFPGQLPHVGEHYDLQLDGNETRIVVIGQEYGSPNIGFTLDERRERIRHSAAAGFSGRNCHMRGTTSTLRLILGRTLGRDVEGEILIKGTNIHLFDGFALTNMLLCSAISNIGTDGSAKGKASPTMLEECGRHLREVIRILAPTVLVIQGMSKVSWWARRALSFPEFSSYSELVQLRDNPALLFTFYHPSAPAGGWWGNSIKSKYLTQIIEPEIREHLSIRDE